MVYIRPIATIEEYHATARLQMEVWGMPDMEEVVPLNQLLAAHMNGGLVAGAFDEDGTLVGFVYGFVGLTGDGKVKHCSHMAGVLPNQRNSSIGYQLKLFQRRYVQKQGLNLITWTFDPLLSLNARLNIAKLGAISRTYYYNLYGAMNDSLNRGLTSDRLALEWWINSEHVRHYVESEPPREQPSLQSLLDSGAAFALRGEWYARMPEPLRVTHAAQAETLIIEIPADFNAIKANAPGLAKAWRRETSHLFPALFAQGYAVYDFISEFTGELRRNFYILGKQVLREIESTAAR